MVLFWQWQSGYAIFGHVKKHWWILCVFVTTDCPESNITNLSHWRQNFVGFRSKICNKHQGFTLLADLDSQKYAIYHQNLVHLGLKNMQISHLHIKELPRAWGGFIDVQLTDIAVERAWFLELNLMLLNVADHIYRGWLLGLTVVRIM